MAGQGCGAGAVAAWGDALCESLSLGAPPAARAVGRAQAAAAASELRRCESRGEPLLVAGACAAWPATKAWTLEALSERFGAARVRVGLRPEGRPETMPLSDFVAYVGRGADGDPDPRYVFEPRLREPLCSEYDPTVGGLFSNDLLGLLVEALRPPYRWLCLGPRRSGSRPHIDPLATSAWNALISGRKRWVLIDPAAVDTAVTCADVQAGCLSPAEWFRDRLPRLRERCPPGTLREAVQEPGEVMYVPAGVWHAVLNLTDTVAITHNYTGPTEFDRSWRAVSAERPGLAREWLRALRMREPALAQRALRRSPGSGSVEALASPDDRQDELRRAAEGPGSGLLRQRLAGRRRLELPKSLSAGWVAATRPSSASGPRGGGARRTARRYSPGEPVFATKALACVYGDEGGPGRSLAALAERLPRTPEMGAVLGHWGIGRASTGEELMRALSQAVQSTWCFEDGGQRSGPADSSTSRVEGLAVFPCSGLLRHSQDPSLVLTVVGDCCLAVAARSLAADEELTVCRARWRFDEAAHHAELTAAGASAEDDWKASALPPRDGTQMLVVRKFLAQVERTAWGSDSAKQAEAAVQLKGWLAECGAAPLLRAYPYLELRSHMLAVHLSLGTHRLDDAWDAAVRVLDLARHVPPEDAAELCVTFALLGGALAHQLQQPGRARELFAAGGSLLGQVLGADGAAWELWLRTFLPRPLLRAALEASENAGRAVGDLLPGLGLAAEEEGEEERVLAAEGGTNMERWESWEAPAPADVAPGAPAKAGAKAPMEEAAEEAPASEALTREPSESDKPPLGLAPSLTTAREPVPEAWEPPPEDAAAAPGAEAPGAEAPLETGLGTVEVAELDGRITVSLSVAEGVPPENAVVAVAAHVTDCY